MFYIQKHLGLGLLICSLLDLYIKFFELQEMKRNIEVSDNNCRNVHIITSITCNGYIPANDAPVCK